MRKKALSNIIVTLILILIGIILVVGLFIFIRFEISSRGEISEIMSNLADRNIDIVSAKGDFKNPKIVTLDLSMGGGEQTFLRQNISQYNYSIISSSANKTLINVTIPIYWNETVEVKWNETIVVHWNETINITGTKFSEGDVLFLIDSTQSMAGEIADVYNIISNFTKILENSSLNVRVGVIDFRDTPTTAVPPTNCGSASDFLYRDHPFYDSLFIKTRTQWQSGTITPTNVTFIGEYIALNTDPNFYVAVKDQQQKNANSASQVYGSNIIAQTFRPSVTGNLTTVIINAAKLGTIGPLLIEIRRGQPSSGALLASVERNDITSSGDYNFSFSVPPTLTAGVTYSIIIKAKNNDGDSVNNYNVKYYSQYWIPESWVPDKVVAGKWVPQTGSDNQTYIWQPGYTIPGYWKPGYWSNDAYTQGMYCNSQNSGTSWTCLNSCANLSSANPPCNMSDLYFQTYMSRIGYFRGGEVINQYDSGENNADWYNFSILSFSFPTGTSINISFRSSNDLVSWSEWYNYGASTSAFLLNIPGGRYLEQKIVLLSDGIYQPRLNNMQINLNPETFTSNITRFRAEVLTLSPLGNGGDTPESHLSAINRSLSVDWRSTAARFIIMLSDAPPHATDCIFNGVSTDKSCYTGPKSITSLINELVGRNIAFFYINKDGGLCDNRLIEDSMTNLTGGKYYPYTDAAGVDDILLDIATEITVEVENTTYIVVENVSYSLVERTNYTEIEHVNYTTEVREIDAPIEVITQEFQGAEFDYLKVIFYGDTDSYIEKIPFSELPGPLELKKISIDLEGKIDNIKKIEIYPVELTSSGKEVTGPLLSVWDVENDVV